MQVNDALAPLAKAVGLFTKTAFGGAPYDPDLRAASAASTCSSPPRAGSAT